MIFLFGWGRHDQDRGPADWRTCDQCGNPARWRHIETANRLTVFFVPVLTVGRSRWTVCPVCRTGFKQAN